MPPKTKRVIASILIVLLSVALAVFIFPNDRFLTTPDGAVLKLEGVTVDREEFKHGTALERHFARWIPSQGLSFLGYRLTRPSRHSIFDNEDGYLVVWLSCSGTNFFRVQGQLNNVSAQAVADDGKTYENHEVFGGSVVQSKLGLVFFKLKAFPRNQRNFSVRLCMKDGPDRWVQSDAIMISNPLRTNSVPFPATPLPTTNLIGETEFVLDKLETGTGFLKSDSSRPSSRLCLRKRSLTGKTLHWWISYCEARDHLGNYQEFYPSQDSKNGVEWLPSHCLLSPKDVWKIDFVLLPSDLQPVSTDYMEIGFHHIQTRAEVHSKIFNTPVLARYENGVIHVSLPSSPIEVGLFQVKLKDENGNHISVRRDAKRMGHELSIPAEGLEKFNLEVALQRRLKFQYFVKPTLIGNRAAANSNSGK